MVELGVPATGDAERAVDVLARVTTVLAGADLVGGRVEPVEPGARILAGAYDDVLERALAVLRELPGVGSVGIDTGAGPSGDLGGSGGELRLPLRGPGGTLVVTGTPDATVRAVLGAAADQLGAVLRNRRRVLAAAERDRRAAAAYAWLGSLVDALPQAVLVEDGDRRLARTNRAFADMFDLPATPEGMVGADMDRLLSDAAAGFVDPEEFVRLVRRRMSDRVPVTGDEVITLDGRVLDRDFVPIGTAGSPDGCLWIFRDVTKRKREEERLAEEYQRLVGVTAAKNRFVASVSHELRTPLTSIVSFANLLADPESGPLTEEQHEFLDIVERNASRLIRLVGDLLMLSRLESGAVALEMDDVDPADLLTECARAQAVSASRHGVDLQLRTAPGEAIVGDGDRLGQVLDNLLSNAIKFTPPGGRVAVSAVPDPAGWTVEISDTGIGIPADEQPHLFTEFYRASNSRTDATPGTGLGLVISRLIVDRHGGDLRLMSEENQGTTAVLRLPAAGAGRVR